MPFPTREELPIIPGTNTIIATMTNSGYLPYTRNMLKSIAPFGLSICIFTVDTKAAEKLRQLGYSYVYDMELTLSEFISWNNEGYDTLCEMKLKIIHHVLSLSVNILMVDGDIVFLKNPMKELCQWDHDRNTEIYVQNDSDSDLHIDNLCTGFIFIRATKRLILLYDVTSIKGKARYDPCRLINNDQSYFNLFIKPFVVVKPLSLHQYPNGSVFYKNPELASCAILIHFNWTEGHLKMLKMKEHGQWLLTRKEERR